MSFLSQTNFPKAWLFGQRMIGGTPDKQRLLRHYYKGHKRVLEIGCSVGNLAEAFLEFPDIDYLGIDIDLSALAYAQSRFANNPNFTFSSQTLQEIKSSGQSFDFIAFAGVLHHVNDEITKNLMEGVREVAAPGATIVFFEPLPFRKGDTLTYRFFHMIEQGQFIRSWEELERLICAAGLSILEKQESELSPGLTSYPKIIRFGLIRAAVVASQQPVIDQTNQGAAGLA